MLADEYNLSSISLSARIQLTESYQLCCYLHHQFFNRLQLRAGHYKIPAQQQALPVRRNVMVTFIIIIAVAFGIALYIKFLSYIDYQRYLVEHQEIFAAHKKIGYPQLTLSEQYNILDTENLESILKLTEYKFVPTGLLNYYINIKPSEYFGHLKVSSLEKKMKFDPNDLTDGFFINKGKKSYEYIFRDRNRIVFRKKFSTYDKLLNYLVYDRLSLYAPKKYKFAWLKKHFA